MIKNFAKVYSNHTLLFQLFSIILQLSGIGFINLRKERSTTVNYVKVYGIYTHLPILTEKSIRIYLKLF